MPTEFEQQFSSVAYSMLQQTDIDVSKYLLGFEVVHSNDKKTKAVGIFILKINDEYYYIPVFFINGIIQPLTLLYNPKKDVFMPLSSEWITFLETSEYPSVGEGEDEESVKLQPKIDIHKIMQVPYTKTASLKKNELKLLKFIRKAPIPTKITFLNILHQNPFLEKTATKLYNEKSIRKACEVKNNFDKLQVITEPLKAKTKSEYLEFLKKGYFIRDLRKRTLHPIFMEKVADVFKTPTKPGVYRVMTNKGFKKVFITKPYDLVVRQYEEDYLILDPISGYYDYKPIKDILVQHIEKFEDEDEFYTTTPINHLEAGHRYILLIPERRNIKITLPIYIDTVNRTEDGNVFYKATTFHCEPIILAPQKGVKRIIKASVGTENYDVTPPGFKQVSDYPTKTVNVPLLIKKPDVALTIYIPLESEAVKVSNENDFYVLDGIHMNSTLMQSYAKIDTDGEKTVLVNGHKVEAPTETPPNEKQAEWVLLNLGFSRANAQKILEKKSAWVPYQSPLMPPVQVQYPTQGSFPNMPVNARSLSPAIQNNIEAEQEMLNNLSEISPEIFDKGFIGVLAKLTDVQEIIQEYIPYLTKALDKLGRLIFIFYYRYDAIKDKFGLNEYNKDIDILRNTFLNLGKIIIDIKRKYNI